MRFPQALDGRLEGVRGHDLDRIERREAGIDVERFDPLNAVLFGELRRAGFGDGHEDPGVVGNVDRTDFRCVTAVDSGPSAFDGGARSLSS